MAIAQLLVLVDVLQRLDRVLVDLLQVLQRSVGHVFDCFILKS